ncbi:DNA topoisomerase IB [Rhodobacteraceae bacterium CCMM004]|nr:DNA topoisomerase IB [Rhodobacteraceae bacterium CCMM004]
MRAAGDLIYFPDDRPGISRRRAGRGWSYRAPDGTRIDDAGERARIAALAVPPAYRDVWICPRADGHLQATGRDARARKQYRYHPDWAAWRAKRKFADLARFGAALPRIRRRIRADLTGDPGDRDLAIAAVLAMIDRLAMRVGGRGYAQDNGTYGATTLRSRHLRLAGDELRLSYPGKGGLRVRRRLRDRGLARALHRLDDLEGATLVGWTDDDGRRHDVTAGAVNERLSEIAGHDVTAKTFRTWTGSAAALEAALAADAPTVTLMAEAASERLANTPAVARSAYIHPKVLGLVDWSGNRRQRLVDGAPEIRDLRRAERALLSLIG